MQNHETVDRSRGELVASLGHNNVRLWREVKRLRQALRHSLELQRIAFDGWRDERAEGQRYQELAAKARTEAQEVAVELKNVGVELTLAVQEATRLRRRVMELEREQGKTPEEMRRVDARHGDGPAACDAKCPRCKGKGVVWNGGLPGDANLPPGYILCRGGR